MAGKVDISQRKRRANAGFSLTEMLAAIAILALVGMVVVSGMPAAQNAYISVTDASNAQVLLSSTTTRLRDELAVAKPGTITAGADANASGKLVEFESYETGFTVKISNSPQGLVISKTSKADPGAVIEEPLVAERTTAGAASGNLRANVGSIAWNEAAGIFTVSDIQVFRKAGETPFSNASQDKLEVKVLAA